MHPLRGTRRADRVSAQLERGTISRSSNARPRGPEIVGATHASPGLGSS